MLFPRLRRLDYSWVILAAAFTVMFFGGGANFIFGLLLKPMTEDMGWTRSSLSLALTTFMVVSALLMPFAGRLLDRYDLRWVIAAGVAAIGAGVGLMAGVTALWQVFLLYGIVFALGMAGASVPSIGVMISRWFERRTGIANSAAIAGMAVGQLVIITLLASLLSTIGWRASYAAVGAANVFVVVPIVLAAVRSRPPGRLLPDAEADGEVSPAATTQAVEGAEEGVTSLAAELLLSRQMWLLVAVYAVCGFQDFFVSTHVVAFAVDQGVSEVLAGNMLGLMGLMGLIGVMLAGVLSDRYGPTRPTALCFLIRIGIFALILFFQSTVGIVVFALLYGSTFLITAPLLVVFARDSFGAGRLGVVSGVLSMVHQICGGLGAFVGAYIFDHRGSYDDAFLIVLIMALLAVGATAMVRDKPPEHRLEHV